MASDFLKRKAQEERQKNPRQETQVPQQTQAPRRENPEKIIASSFLQEKARKSRETQQSAAASTVQGESLVGKRQKLDEAQKTLEAAAGDVSFWGDHMKLLESSYKASPTKENKALYDKGYALAQKSQEAYNSARDAYAISYAGYEPAYTQYASVLKEANALRDEYNGFVNGDRSSADIARFTSGFSKKVDSLLARSKESKYSETLQIADFLSGLSDNVGRLRNYGRASNESFDYVGGGERAAEMVNYLINNKVFTSDIDTKSRGENDILGQYRDMMASGDVIGQNHLLGAANKGAWRNLNDNEIKTYYALWDGEGEKAAKEYLEKLIPTLQNRTTQEVKDIFTDPFHLKDLSKYSAVFGTNGVFSPERREQAEEVAAASNAVLSLGTVPFSILGGVPAFVDDAAHIVTGQEIDPYNGAHMLQNIASGVRGEVAADIDKVTDNANLGGFSAGDAYQGLMSAADAFVASQTIGSTAYGVLMGTNAASSKAAELYERGASNGQIAVEGLAAGIFEGLFEKYSLDKFVGNFMKGNPSGLIDAIKRMVLQGATEGSEEFFTEWSNKLTDTIVMGWNSIAQNAAAYKAKGDVDAVAWPKAIASALGSAFANGENWIQSWESFAGGLVSGVAMGSGGATAGYVNQKNLGTAMAADADLVESTMLQAMKYGIHGSALNSVQESIDRGEAVKPVKIGALYQQVQDAAIAQDTKKIQSAVKNRLTELGETKDADKVAAAVAKAITIKSGAREEVYLAEDRLTMGEKNLIKNSKYGDQVMEELSSEYQDWTGSIGTEEVNYDAYNRFLRENGIIPQGAEEGTQARQVAENGSRTEAVNTPAVDTGATIAKEVRAKFAENENPAVNPEAAAQQAFRETVRKGNTAAQSPSDALERAMARQKNAAVALAVTEEQKQQKQAAKDAYTVAAISGMNAESVNSKYARLLTQQERVEAYNDGKRLREQEGKSYNGGVANQKPGLDLSDSATNAAFQNISKEQREMVHAIGIKSRVRIAADEGLKGTRYNAQYDPSTATIRFNPEAKDLPWVIAGHEVSHRMQELAPKEYQLLRDRAMEHAAKNGDVSEAVEQYKAGYKEAVGQELSTEDALDEVVADYIKDLMMNNQNQFEDLVRTDMTLAQKLKKVIHEIVGWFRRNAPGTSAEKEFALVEKAWEEALTAAEKNAAALKTAAKEKTAAKNTVRNSVDAKKGIRYSVALNAEDNVKKVLTDFSYRDDVRLTDNTPGILASQKGVKNYPMVMKPSHIRENILTEQEARNLGLEIHPDDHYHGLGVPLFMKVIEDLDDEGYAFRGTKNASEPSRRENYFLIISKHKDADENTINVPVYINEKGNVNRVMLDVNRIATVFGKEDLDQYIRNEVRNGNLVRVKNKSTQVGERTIHKIGGYGSDASGDSISEPNPVVNTSDKNSEKNSVNLPKGNVSIFRSGEVLNTDPAVLQETVSQMDTSGMTAAQMTAYNKFKSNVERMAKAREDIQKYEAKGDQITEAEKRKLASARRILNYARSELFALGDSVTMKAVTDKVRENLVKKYGAIKQGEEPARKVQIPLRTDKDNKVSMTARTAVEAAVTDDAMAQEIIKEIDRSTFSYVPITDKDAKAKATETIQKKGWDDAVMDWEKEISKGGIGKYNVALGFELYNNAVTKGDYRLATRILAEITGAVHEGAQAVQAVRILKQLTPEYQLYGIQMQVNTLQEKLDERYGKKAPQLDLNDALVQAFMDAETDEERRQAEKALYTYIASQLPTTFLDRWDALRYLSMLGNARTHIRNVLGNAAFAPVISTKNLVGAGLEKLAMRKGGQRTKAFVSRKSDLYKAAAADYETAMEMLEDQGKYKNAINQIDKIKQEKFAFGTKNKLQRGLSKMAEWNSNALNMEDIWFSQRAYGMALAGYLKANNVTAEQFQSGDVPSDFMDAARAYAITEAQKSTYRDANDFSNFVTSIGSGLDNKFGKVGKVMSPLVSGVLPFRRTPANILARAVEYSPVGLLVNGVVDPLYAVPQGKKTVAEALDEIAAGLTGTLLFGLGAFLAYLGLVTGAEDDDKEQAEYDRLNGVQDYALNIGGKSYTIDWLAPEAIPMFMGVGAFNSVEENGWSLELFLDMAKQIPQPMLEMSMLSGLNDVLDQISFEDNKIVAGLVSAATSYLTQPLPTLFGQLERITEGERNTTFTDRDSLIPRDIQYILANSMNKLPGEYNQVPYIDAWGRTESTGNVFQRAFENLLSPGYFGETKEDPSGGELQRLYDQGYEDVFPSTLKKSATLGQDKDGNKIYMTAEQYTMRAQVQGQTAFNAIRDIVNTGAYKDATDAEKAEMIGDAYDYASNVGRYAVDKDASIPKWVKETMEASQSGKVSAGNVIAARSFMRNAESDKDEEGNAVPNSKKQKVVDYIQSMPVSAAEKRTIWDAIKGSWTDKGTPWE